MHGRRILVVEDDADIREATIDILVDHGFDAVGAANGREALDRLHAGGDLPCLILLDLMMPVLDGRGFCAEQQRNPELARIPVVVVSARCDSAQHAAELGAAGCLDKPVKLGDLLRVSRRHCRPD
jgi:CheY-like chemotaxis protein